MDSITGIATTDKVRSFWQIFLDGVTAVLNYDYELCFHLEEFLSDSRELEKL